MSWGVHRSNRGLLLHRLLPRYNHHRRDIVDLYLVDTWLSPFIWLRFFYFLCWIGTRSETLAKSAYNDAVDASDIVRLT